MRCLACNKRLSEFEATVKYASTGEPLDLCTSCRVFVGNIQLVEREDLKSNEEILSDCENDTTDQDQED